MDAQLDPQMIKRIARKTKIPKGYIEAHLGHLHTLGLGMWAEFEHAQFVKKSTEAELCVWIAAEYKKALDRMKGI